MSAPPLATAPATASETTTLPAPVEAIVPSAPPSSPLVGAPVTAAVVVAAVPPADAAAPPPSTLAFSAIPGTTGSASASSLRCVATSVLKARQLSHVRRCRRNDPRRKAAPVAVASSTRMSSQGVARASRLAASDVRAEHERLHLLPWTVEHGRDPRVVERTELGEQERRPLVLRQAGEVGEQLAQILAPPPTVAARPVGRGLRQLDRDVRTSCAQQRQAAVAGDREQPRTQVDRLLAAHQTAKGRQERVLDGVLGLLARAEHVAAEAEDRGVVAVVERLERAFVAAADERDEPLVARESQEAGGPAQTQRRALREDVLHAGIMSITAIGTPSPCEGW